MTYEDIKERIKLIEEGKYDPEWAHSEQDKLFVDVLQAISNNDYNDIFGPSASNLAYAALAVLEIDFPRWLA